MLRASRRIGLDQEPLIAGLEFSAQTVLRPQARIPWVDVAHLLERIDAARPGALEAFAESWVHSMPLFGWLATYLSTPAAFYRAVSEGCRRVWHFMECSVEVTAEGHLDWTTKLPEPNVSCEQFFRASTVMLRVLPRLLGAPDAEVEAQIGSREARWRIKLPADSGALEGVKEASIGRIFSDLAQELLELAGPRKVMHTDIPLTAAEGRVVDLLSQGNSTKAIASSLDISLETVRSHLKRAMSKFGVHRQHELVVKALNHSKRRRATK